MSRAWLDAARQIDGLKIVGLVDKSSKAQFPKQTVCR